MGERLYMFVSLILRLVFLTDSVFTDDDEQLYGYISSNELYKIIMLLAVLVSLLKIRPP